MQCLLDKVTVRHSLTGILKVSKGTVPSSNELLALRLIFGPEAGQQHLFISPSTANILRQLAQSSYNAPSVDIFSQQVSVLLPTRYFKRWSRRLREYGFAREDAAILALGTFGSVANTFTSVDYIATFDQRMINNWMNQQSAIQSRFHNMRGDLATPYINARLPLVFPPEQIKF